MKLIKKPPDTETCDHVQCPVGEIGKPTDSIDQSKTDCHQRERKTIDDSVNYDVHRKIDIGILERWNGGISEK
jgi:hypothetical protein